jgi:thymidylate synthase
MMVADQCGLGYGEFIHTFGDAHIYTNHINQVEQQLKRDFRPLPNLLIKKNVSSIYDYIYNDFVLNNYNPHSHIKAEVSI